MLSIKKEEEKGSRFSLKTEKGNVLLTSILFNNEVEMRNTIGELKPQIGNQLSVERKTDTTGKFLFSILNTNRKVIANSQLYSSEAGMENGIKNLKKRIASLSQLSNL